jgi:poly(A) polymerase/tRNA nucleotidyltransferase (CCA-adding enzyme)
MKKTEIPNEVSRVTQKICSAGFEAHLVGGCVRDILLGNKPKDWDIATNAKPEQIQDLFEHTFYENKFGTVGVVSEKTKDETLEIIEVTTYRTESTYSDNRRPDEIIFSKHINDDLKRRDFTINALAFNLCGETYVSRKNLIDPFHGVNDLEKKQMRAVGGADERFKEDALRILRVVRLATELGFSIEKKTAEAIKRDRDLLKNISKERIRDEIVKIVMSDEPARGVLLLRDLDLLEYTLPEIQTGINVKQGGIHKYDVFEHLVRSLQHAAEKKCSLEVRLAALFHDIAKPVTRGDGKHKEYSFYGHEVIGAKIVKNILNDFNFPKKTVNEVQTLVRWHMFFSDTEQITLSAVRRLIQNVGKENIEPLMLLRICDRIGSGRPKEEPYRLRKYKSMIEEAMRDPVSVKMLKIDGGHLMKELNEKPGPKIGYILHALLEEVIEDPKKNTKKFLVEKAEKLIKLPISELEKQGRAGMKRKEDEEAEKIKDIRSKYWVN